MTPQTARRLLDLKAGAQLQARVNYLAARNSEGLLTPEERDEYRNYVSFGTMIAIVKSKARQLLAKSHGD